MFRRLWNIIKTWFGAGLDKIEDPELLLQQAQEEMRAMHAKNRERAVQAITQKNNLQHLVEDTLRTLERLIETAELAESRGDPELARRLRHEADAYAKTLAQTQSKLDQAMATSEAVQDAIRREEEKIRRKTREALDLKREWRLRNGLSSPDDTAWLAENGLALFLALLIVLLLIILIFG
jgi:phage shock protein A